MLIHVDTGNALHVKERPIVALHKDGRDEQKWKYLAPEWKYLAPEPSVRITYILLISLVLILVTNIFSSIKWVSART